MTGTCEERERGEFLRSGESRTACQHYLLKRIIRQLSVVIVEVDGIALAFLLVVGIKQHRRYAVVRAKIRLLAILIVSTKVQFRLLPIGGQQEYRTII